MAADEYIVVLNWDKFQHYKKRNPPWIKSYVDLLSREEYLDLSLAQRGLLHGIWLEYSRSAQKLPRNTSALSRRLGVKVSKKTLDSLYHAGFIEFSASRTLARRYQDARPETETETETDAVTRTDPNYEQHRVINLPVLKEMP